MRADRAANGDSDGGPQAAVLAFLSNPESYGPGSAGIERIDTHISSVFLAGSRAYKLKRAVDFGYLNYTDPAERHRLCEEEVARNRRTAPDLYLGVVAITREADGDLAFDGTGTAVDWVVAMRRFDESLLFDNLARHGELRDDHLVALADEIARFHAAAARRGGGSTGFARSLESSAENIMARTPDPLPAADAAAFIDGCRRAFDACAALLDARARDGFVRRCHGDLHLRNICLYDGRPTLFDCIEFSDALSDIDVLYDLAFLLMDLEHRGLRRQGNLVMNRYAAMTGDSAGLGALPLFLALRAGIRAHTGAAAALVQQDAAGRERQRADCRAYLRLGLDFLTPAAPVLVAVGGLSGSGKSALARALAPELGAAPGALHLSSDVIRKRLFGAAPETRLGSNAYAPAVSARVYGALRDRAAAALAGGHAVIVDATHLTADSRAEIAEVASAAGVPFVGLWLDAPAEVMEARVLARTGDASDADIVVLRDQLRDAAPVADWVRIDAGGNPAQIVGHARAALADAIE